MNEQDKLKREITHLNYLYFQYDDVKPSISKEAIKLELKKYYRELMDMTGFDYSVSDICIGYGTFEEMIILRDYLCWLKEIHCDPVILDLIEDRYVQVESELIDMEEQRELDDLYEMLEGDKDE